jgi:hypothetical protein
MKDYTHIIEVRLYDGETPVNEFRYINDTTIKIGSRNGRSQGTLFVPDSARVRRMHAVLQYDDALDKWELVDCTGGDKCDVQLRCEDGLFTPISKRVGPPAAHRVVVVEFPFTIKLGEPAYTLHFELIEIRDEAQRGAAFSRVVESFAAEKAALLETIGRVREILGKGSGVDVESAAHQVSGERGELAALASQTHDTASRANRRIEELEAEAVILRQYAIAGATFAGMRDEIALPVSSWPHVGEFAAFLAGAVTMHRRMGGEQGVPNHLDADGRDASVDPRPGDVWVIDGRPWVVKLPDPRFIPAPNMRPEIELENCDTLRRSKSILRSVWTLFAAPHTFVRNLNEPTQLPIDEKDPDRPSLAQVG